MQIHSKPFEIACKSNKNKFNEPAEKKESCGSNEIRVLMLSSSYANHDDIPFSLHMLYT
jgi:hypothetical protein